MIIIKIYLQRPQIYLLQQQFSYYKNKKIS